MTPKQIILILALLFVHAADAAAQTRDAGVDENDEGPRDTAVREIDTEVDSDAAEQPPLFIPPELKVFKEATYPEAALEQGIEADVVLEIDIDAEGAVEGVNVLVPAEPAGLGFDEAAVEAAFGFEFEPAREGDSPVPVRITYKYRFVLADKAEASSRQNGAPPAQSSEPVGTPTPSGDFQGELVERGTRLPLPGVTVIVFRGEGDTAEGYETVSDEDGRFSFLQLAPGEWKVLAEPEGYFPLRTTEHIAAGERTESKYYIEKGAYNPYDVLVEGQRTRKVVNRTTLSIDEAEKVPGTFGDVLGVVKNFPGVARTSPIGGNLVVRGSSPEDTQVFVDSVNVPILYHFVGLKSVVPAGMLESIDFYPGNFSSYYGRATGGIVDVKLKELDPEKVGGYLDVNILDSGLYLEAPVTKKLAVAGGFRRSYFDGIIKAASGSGAPVDVVSAPRYYDYQFLARLRPNSKHELKTFVFGSDDRLVAVVENPADISPELRASEASTKTSFYRGILEYDLAPDENVRNELKASFGRNSIYAGLGDQIFLDLDFYVAQVRDTFTLKMADGLSVMGGVDYLFSKTDLAVKFPSFAKEGEFRSGPVNETIRFDEQDDLTSHSIAGYLELEAVLFDRLYFIPGLRYDYYTRVSKGALSPRLVLRYELAEKWTLKGGVGMFNQEPQFDETSPIFGNPNLGLELANHYSLGVEYRPLPQLLIDVTGFYKDMNSLVSRTSATVVRDGDITPLNFNNGGAGRVYGAEFLVRHEPANNFSGWLAYTISRAERRDYGSDEYRLFDFDQTHILTLVGSYRLPKNWTVGLRYRLVSGRLYTPRLGAVYNADRNAYEPIAGETNSRRMPPFHQLDIRFDKTWVFDNWMFTAYLDLQNAYNRANPEGYRYNYDSTQKEVRSGLPIVPVLGLKGEF